MKSSIKTGIFNAMMAGALLISAGAAVPALAAVPELINFQGKLTDASGKAVTTAVHIVFSFYTAAANGTPVWTEAQTVTPDDSGVYSVLLGEVMPLNISFSTGYWLGVAVGTDAEMLPRYKMVSSAYSLYSLNSATAAYSLASGTAAWSLGADWPSITNKLAAGTTTDGYITAIDWNVFSGKLSASGNGSALTDMTAGQVNLGSVNNTSDASKPISTLQQGALDLKAALTGAAFSGGISASNLSGSNTGDENAAGIKTKLGAANATSDGYLTTADWNIFSGKLAASGNGSALTDMTAGQVNLGSVNNTSDAAKPVSTLQQGALDLKAALTGAAFSGLISASNLSGSNTGDENAAGIKTKLGAAGVATDGYLTAADWNIFSGKLSASGNGSALTDMTAGQVNLGSVNNTSDAAKPVSTLQQGALDLKAALTGAAFSGLISATNLSGSNTGDENAAGIKTKLGAAGAATDGYLTTADWNVFSGKLSASGNGSALTDMTAGQVNLGSVNNTSDASKPISTLQQGALALKANLAGGAAFDGSISATNLSGTNTGDQSTITGNAGTATKLQSARAINGVSFDGSVDITIPVPVTSSDDTTYASAVYPLWTTAAGTNAVKLSAAKLSFVPATGRLTAAGVVSGKGFINASQHVDLVGAPDLTTFAVDGSGVVLLNQLIGDHPIATITGCSSGVVAQGQTVTFVMAAYTTSGTLTFLDTTVGAAVADNMLLNGAVTWAPAASPASIGSSITLLCTTVIPAAAEVKLWVEVAHSIAN